ncbi:hypothetical protein ARMGADRAFT_877602, partial [Armillaria gallica]
ANTATELLCGWCICKGYGENECETKKHSHYHDHERATNNILCFYHKGNHEEKGDSKEETTLQVNSVKEEKASHGVINCSSPAISNWNTDTGASHSMTPNCDWFKVYSPHIIPICLANDMIIYLKGIRSVVIKPEIERENTDLVEIPDILHVPAL